MSTAQTLVMDKLDYTYIEKELKMFRNRLKQYRYILNDTGYNTHQLGYDKGDNTAQIEAESTSNKDGYFSDTGDNKKYWVDRDGNEHSMKGNGDNMEQHVIDNGDSKNQLQAMTIIKSECDSNAMEDTGKNSERFNRRSIMITLNGEKNNSAI